MSDSQPLISLLLVVKDGMPYLPEAIASVQRQTYRNFELIVQDAVSTDGTLEILRGITDLPHIDIVSKPDNGVGQAYQWALERSRGAIIGTIDADNLLEPDALEIAVRRFAEFPHAAAIYGANRMIDANGKTTNIWHASDFDLLQLLQIELVPPYACSFFHRENCGAGLRFSEHLKSCQDFDLWLRLSHLPILRIEDVIAATRISDKSMSCNAETYDSYCRYKIDSIDRFLANLPAIPLTEALRRHAHAGVYLWSAEMMFWLGKNRTDFEHYCALAEALDPQSSRLERVRRLWQQRSPPADSSMSCSLAQVSGRELLKELAARLQSRIKRMISGVT